VPAASGPVYVTTDSVLEPVTENIRIPVKIEGGQVLLLIE